MEKVLFVSIRKGDIDFGIDQVRQLNADAFKRTFGARAVLGAKESQSVIVQLSQEHVQRLNAGQRIKAEELGVFSSATAAKVSTENDVLKTELSHKDALIAELQARLEKASADAPTAKTEKKQ